MFARKLHSILFISCYGWPNFTIISQLSQPARCVVAISHPSKSSIRKLYPRNTIDVRYRKTNYQCICFFFKVDETINWFRLGRNGLLTCTCWLSPTLCNDVSTYTRTSSTRRCMCLTLCNLTAKYIFSNCFVMPLKSRKSTCCVINSITKYSPTLLHTRCSTLLFAHFILRVDGFSHSFRLDDGSNLKHNSSPEWRRIFCTFVG